MKYNGGPTADGYYSTLAPLEVHRVESSDGGSSGGGGSSDFSTAQVTVRNTLRTKVTFSMVCLLFDDLQKEATVQAVQSNNFVTVLYKGCQYIATPTEVSNVETEGSAEYDGGIITITGDCTITIS